jgi:hypothetical protein|tara:strand:+ start:2627 stop:2761 length:135 start_codon:yes stop_codon:yes gene_type:complete
MAKHDKQETVEVETPAAKADCSCGAAGCGGRDIYCKVHKIETNF